MLKVISFYLPQFHSIPENDAVWGKGFTEWDSVKSAKPLFDGHEQPRTPFKGEYYNLLNEDTIYQQTQLAKKYNVFGFCIYHYWFSGKKLLNKPLEIIRDSEKINFPYCICWANESWTDAWTATDKPKSFLKQEYGDKQEWKEHFDYLLTFFKDPNYILENNKPMLVIYRPENIPNLNEKLDFWSDLAKDNGFDGIQYAYQQIEFEEDPNSDDSRFTYSIEYQPVYARRSIENNSTNKQIGALKKHAKSFLQGIKRKYDIDLLKVRHEHLKKNAESVGPRVMDYAQVSEAMINLHGNGKKSAAGMFVGYDDTPRKGRRGLVIQSNAQNFRKYMFKQAQNVKKNYNNDYMFMFAWNEWGESGYLEPDEKSGYAYLEAVKDAVNDYESM